MERGITVNEQIIEKLKEIVGSEHVGHKDFQLVAYSRTWSYEKARLADVIVVPGSTKEVSEIVKLGNESNTPVCGGAEEPPQPGCAFPGKAALCWIFAEWIRSKI